MFGFGLFDMINQLIARATKGVGDPLTWVFKIENGYMVMYSRLEPFTVKMSKRGAGRFAMPGEVMPELENVTCKRPRSVLKFCATLVEVAEVQRQAEIELEQIRTWRASPEGSLGYGIIEPY